MGSNDNHLSYNKKELMKAMLQKKGIQIPESANTTGPSNKNTAVASYAQRRFWFLYEMEPEGYSYNINSSFIINGDLNVEAFKRSFDKIIDRHQTLRTTFYIEDGTLYQKINNHAGDYFRVKALDNNTDDQNSFYKNVAITESQKPFNIYEGPLLNVTIYEACTKEHLVCITLHHIIADGWSIGIISRELSALYENEVTKSAGPINDLDYQFIDYCEEQNINEKNGKLEESKKYWVSQLFDANSILDLPYDKPRMSVQSSNGKVMDFIIESEMLSKIMGLSIESKTSLFMVLYTAYCILIFRETSQEDFTIGIPVAGRDDVRFENLIGPFLNTNVFRNKISHNDSFIQLLDRIRQQTLSSLQHQNMPFEKLVEEINPVRSTSYNPLFQTMFTLQNSSMPELKLNEAKMTMLPIDSNYSQFDLSMTLWNEGEGMKGTIEYCSDIFWPQTIERMKTEYLNILMNITSNPEIIISKIPLITEDMKNKILFEWNRNASREQNFKNVINMFKRQVENVPEAIAVLTENDKIQYVDLDMHSDYLSLILHDLQTETSEPVGICADGSVFMACAILAILKAGGVYVPIDPNSPDERIKHIIKDCSIKLLIMQEKYSDRFKSSGLSSIVLEHIDFSKSRKTNKKSEIDGSSPACIIYTSGSTGIPKGTILSHQNLANLIISFIQSYSPDVNDRILPVTSVASSSFVGEILPILCSGGCVVLCDKHDFLDLEKLSNILIKYKITILSTVPSVLRYINALNYSYPDLRLILGGGETLYPEDINNLFNKNIMIVNGYGATEGTICATFHIVEKNDMGCDSALPIGKPILNNRIYILDNHMNLLGPGCAGNIYTSGVGTCLGYINNTELTDASFSEDIFVPGCERMYKTGDRGYWRENGEVQFIGRKDDQFKIRGYRVERGEIEKAILKCPDIKECVVSVEQHGRHNTGIVAYVASKNDAQITKKQLFVFMRRHIPDYMIPAEIYFIDKIPYLMNGKINYELLKRSCNESKSNIREEAHNKTEDQIINIWKGVLKRDEIGLDDNFFDIGGHSLLIIDVQKRINKIFQNNVSVIDLFQYPTVRYLALFIKNGVSDNFGNEINERAKKMRGVITSSKNIKGY